MKNGSVRFDPNDTLPQVAWDWDDGVIMSWLYDFPGAVWFVGFGELDDSDFDKLAARLGEMFSECARIMWWHGDPPLGAEKIGGGT